MRHRCPNCNFEFDDSGRITSKPRAEKHPEPAAQIILDAFAVLTGGKFRVVPSDVARQATMFAAHFTCEDLDLVVAYIRYGMGADLGFSDQSLTWSKLFGDAITGFHTFQDRLAAADRAQKSRKFRHTPRYVGNDLAPTTQKPAKAAIVPPGNEESAKAESIRSAALAVDLAKLRTDIL